MTNMVEIDLDSPIALCSLYEIEFVLRHVPRAYGCFGIVLVEFFSCTLRTLTSNHGMFAFVRNSFSFETQ